MATVDGIRIVGGAAIGPLTPDTEERWAGWRGASGPPVPVVFEAAVWDSLLAATRDTPAPIERERVFRLFMRRRRPRRVLALTEITSTWANERGTVRWNEGGYPPPGEELRKGGNAMIRDDVELRLDDAWWMGREQTELRVILGRDREKIVVGAWWGRGGSGGLAAQETDGELWPAELLIA